MSGRCRLPPPGWACQRQAGHEGVCFTAPAADVIAEFDNTICWGVNCVHAAKELDRSCDDYCEWSRWKDRMVEISRWLEYGQAECERLRRETRRREGLMFLMERSTSANLGLAIEHARKVEANVAPLATKLTHAIRAARRWKAAALAAKAHHAKLRKTALRMAHELVMTAHDGVFRSLAASERAELEGPAPSDACNAGGRCDGSCHTDGADGHGDGRVKERGE